MNKIRSIIIYVNYLNTTNNLITKIKEHSFLQTFGMRHGALIRTCVTFFLSEDLPES